MNHQSVQEPRALLSSALAEAVRVGLVMCNRHLYAEGALQVSAHRIKQNYCINHDHSDWEPTTTGLGRKKSPTQSLSVWSAGRDTAAKTLPDTGQAVMRELCIKQFIAINLSICVAQDS